MWLCDVCARSSARIALATRPLLPAHVILGHMQLQNDTVTRLSAIDLHRRRIINQIPGDVFNQFFFHTPADLLISVGTG